MKSVGEVMAIGRTFTEALGKALRSLERPGLDVAAHFNGFNSFPLFEKLGDAVQTGPTGNNVRDLRVLLAW